MTLEMGTLEYRRSIIHKTYAYVQLFQSILPIADVIFIPGISRAIVY
jgi:hypothetical protein